MTERELKSLSGRKRDLYMMIKQELYRGATSIKATDIEYDEVHKIFLLVCRDHPEIFWLSGNTKFYTYSDKNFVLRFFEKG